MLRIHSVPNLRSPALLCGFSGWADAASAASGALRYLLLKRTGKRVADFDPDAIFSYTTTRPITLADESTGRRLQWPELAWFTLEVPEAERDLVVLVGPEPDLRWRECSASILDFALRLGVSRLVTFGAFLAQVHYAGPPALLGVSTDLTLRARMLQLGIGQSSYQGPTGFVTALLTEAANRGIPASSLWVAAPSYLSNSSNPKLAAALLQAAEQLLGQDLWRQELEKAGQDMEQHIAEALRTRPDLADFLGRLSGEQTSIAPDPPDVSEQEQELPSAEEVLRDLEEHLRRLKGNSDPSESD